MDDPDLAWPAWKFGMKRGDLFTKLHAEYNTVPSAIQDPEAFHHDVYEISHEARTPDEFHRMMAVRKDQRLRELNDSLESASLTIIANPSLIGTEQWQYAVQLFRTKSLDSLVRYFASYLPGEHPWHRSSDESSVESDASDSIANSLESSFFEDKPIHHEPFSMSTAAQLPPSPRSMTMSSDSVDMAHHYVINTLTPARTLSFSESESDRFGLKDSCPHLHDDDTSQSSGPETPVSSICDLSETDHHDFVVVAAETSVEASHDDSPTPITKQLPSELDSQTPTPKPDAPAGGSCFFAATLSSPSSSLARHRNRSISPSRAFPLVHAMATYKDCRKSPRLQRRDLSPVGKGRGRSPAHRVQKPLPDPIRTRPRGRRRVEGSSGC